MIAIVETNRPRKVPGKTSFIATFPYDQRIVEAMKSLPTFSYDKASQSWEFPADCLAEALDSLTFLSDIRLSFLKDGPAEKGLSPLTE